MAIYDVQDAFTDLLMPIVIIQSAPGKYVEGKWIEGTPTLTPAEAVVHPMSENEINALKIEGYQGNEMMRFYIPDKYLAEITSNVAPKTADIINYNGAQYTALKKKDWVAIGGYQTMYCGETE